MCPLNVTCQISGLSLGMTSIHADGFVACRTGFDPSLMPLLPIRGRPSLVLRVCMSRCMPACMAPTYHAPSVHVQNGPAALVLPARHWWADPSQMSLYFWLKVGHGVFAPNFPAETLHPSMYPQHTVCIQFSSVWSDKRTTIV